MSVISVCISTRRGRLVVSRQYSPISKAKLEGLVVAFPKFLTKDQQHTYVETENHRYLYSLLGEDLYLILLTHRNSNMIQDMTLLRTLFELTQLRMKNILTEESAVENGFDLIFAYDECISTLGHPEMLSSEQVDNILKMESHEEDIQDLIVESQILEAQKKARDAATKIARMLKENDGKYRTGIASRAPSEPDRLTSSSSSGSSGGSSEDRRRMRGASSEDDEASARRDRDRTAARKRRRGLVLVPKRTRQGSPKDDGDDEAPVQQSRRRVFEQKSFLEEMGIAAEPEEEPSDLDAAAAASSGGGGQKNPPPPVSDKPVDLALKETVFAEIDNRAEEINCMIRGKLDIAVNDPAYANVELHLEQARQQRKLFRMQAHPKTDRPRFSRESVIALKQGVRGFRVGGAPLTVVTWKLKPSLKSDESVLPVLITCWPNESSDGMTITLEFEVQREDIQMHDLRLRVPLPAEGEVTVDAIEVGTYRIRQGRGGGRYLVWRIPMMGGDEKGSLEFSIDEGSEDSFFPIEAKFQASRCLSGLSVASVVQAEGGDNVPFFTSTTCDVEKYSLLSN